METANSVEPKADEDSAETINASESDSDYTLKLHKELAVSTVLRAFEDFATKIDELKAENANVKIENDKLKMENKELKSVTEKLEADKAYHKALGEKLWAEKVQLTVENRKLKGEVDKQAEIRALKKRLRELGESGGDDESRPVKREKAE